MGYFSELDITLKYREDNISQKQERLDALYRQRSILEDQLAELEDIRPFDVGDPMYDLYFFADHITEPWELSSSVQGIVTSIQMIDEQISELERHDLEHIHFLNTILDTRATPDGQFVLSAALFPLEDLWLTAA